MKTRYSLKELQDYRKEIESITKLRDDTNRHKSYQDAGNEYDDILEVMRGVYDYMQSMVLKNGLLPVQLGFKYNVKKLFGKSRR